MEEEELDKKKGYNRFIAVLGLCNKNKRCNFNNGCYVLINDPGTTLFGKNNDFTLLITWFLFIISFS